MAESPTGRELEILKTLWELGPSTVAEVRAHMCPNDELAFNTVQTTLRIMDAKGHVRHRRRGRAFVYSARCSRKQETKRFLKNVFDGAVDQCVLSLLESQNLSEAEFQELEQILTKARKARRGSQDKQE